jgi:hypothetical protein
MYNSTNTVVRRSNCGACNLVSGAARVLVLVPIASAGNLVDEDRRLRRCSLNEASLPNPTRFASPGNRLVHGRLLSCVVSRTRHTILNALRPSEFQDSATATRKSRWTLLTPPRDLVLATGQGKEYRRREITYLRLEGKGIGNLT